MQGENSCMSPVGYWKSQRATSKYVSMSGIRCQATVEQRKHQRAEMKDKEGYTHGLGMLIQLQALWAYFLTQKAMQTLSCL